MMSLVHLSQSAGTPMKAKLASILSKISENEGFPRGLSSMTFGGAIQELTNFRLTLPDKHSFLSVIDSVLIPLMELEFHNLASAGQYDIHQDLSLSFGKDCFLSDLKNCQTMKICYSVRSVIYWVFNTSPNTTMKAQV